MDVDIFAMISFSGSGVGGNAPGRPTATSRSSGVVGCDDSGPLPGVGGRAIAGERGGESGGAGMLVPAVSEKSTGESVKNDFRAGRVL